MNIISPCTDHGHTTKTTLLPSDATPPSLATLSNIISQDRHRPTGDYYLVGPSSPEGSTVGPRVLSHHLVYFCPNSSITLCQA